MDKAEGEVFIPQPTKRPVPPQFVKPAPPPPPPPPPPAKVEVDKARLYRLIFSLLTGSTEGVVRGSTPRVISELFACDLVRANEIKEEVKQFVVHGG